MLSMEALFWPQFFRTVCYKLQTEKWFNLGNLKEKKLLPPLQYTPVAYSLAFI